MNKFLKLRKYLEESFRERSGGKRILALKRIAPFAFVSLCIFGALSLWFSKPLDRSHYQETNMKPGAQMQAPKPITATLPVAKLFDTGKKTLEAEKKRTAAEKQKKVSIKYLAAQVLGGNMKGPKGFRSGAKLIGMLLNPIDTRAQSIARVKVLQGSEQSDVRIETGSTLLGHYSYNGNGNKVYLSFFRMDSPDGDSRKFVAAGLDAGDYTPGVSGEEFTGTGVKTAANIGFNMLAGMTDTLTARTSLGNMFEGVQATPTMQNALLQGISKASQDQASRVESAVNSEKAYVVVPEGKEMIIELSEDLSK